MSATPNPAARRSAGLQAHLLGPYRGAGRPREPIAAVDKANGVQTLQRLLSVHRVADLASDLVVRPRSLNVGVGQQLQEERFDLRVPLSGCEGSLVVHLRRDVARFE
jgi:hypothetical protein